jgi:hypothetical protein
VCRQAGAAEFGSHGAEEDEVATSGDTGVPAGLGLGLTSAGVRGDPEAPDELRLRLSRGASVATAGAGAESVEGSAAARQPAPRPTSVSQRSDGADSCQGQRGLRCGEAEAYGSGIAAEGGSQLPPTS